jgi:hypothetical protein
LRIPPFKSRVFFDVFAVLVERRRPYHAQLAAREHGLEQVRRVHGAVSLAHAKHEVNFIDKENDAAFGRFHFGQNGLQPLLKLAAVLGPRNKGTHVQREQAAAQALRDVAGDDALRQSLFDFVAPGGEEES